MKKILRNALSLALAVILLGGITSNAYSEGRKKYTTEIVKIGVKYCDYNSWWCYWDDHRNSELLPKEVITITTYEDGTVTREPERSTEKVGCC